MTGTPLLDELDRLGDAGARLHDAILEYADRIRREQRVRAQRARFPNVVERVRGYLTNHPGASANEVRAALRVGRDDALAAVRQVRGPVQERDGSAERGAA